MYKVRWINVLAVWCLLMMLVMVGTGELLLGLGLFAIGVLALAVENSKKVWNYFFGGEK